MSQDPHRDKVQGWRLIIHLNTSSIIIIIRIYALSSVNIIRRNETRLFSPGWFPPSQFAISTGHRQWQRRRRQRRSSSLHNSFGRQPEILETYIYAASLVPEERRGAGGQEGDRAEPGVRRLYECAVRERDDRRRCRGDWARGRIPEIRMTSVELAPWCTTRRYALSYQ